MEYLASDARNPDFVGANDPDRALHVTFYESSIQNGYQTELQGRPIFDAVDMIKIQTPGNTLNIIDTLAREEHKRRFPRHWAAYSARTDATTQGCIGTPIEEWPQLSKVQADQFKAMKFLTVEAVAGAGDAQLAGIGMVAGQSVYVMRDKAKAFLELSELSAKNAEADRRIADAKAEAEAQMNKMRAEAAEELAKIKAAHESSAELMKQQFQEMMRQALAQVAGAQDQAAVVGAKEYPGANFEAAKTIDEVRQSAQDQSGKVKVPAKAKEFVAA